MFATEVRWKPQEIQSQSGAHRDYMSNLSKAKAFVASVDNLNIQGVSAKITGCRSLPQSSLSITFTPPMTAQIGTYSAQIFLHQSSFEAKKETEHHFKQLKQMALVFWQEEKNKEKSDVAKC